MPKNQNRPIFLAAGGTGGHLFPAEALGMSLKEKGYKIHLVTDSRGIHYDSLLSQVPIHKTSSATIKAGLIGKIKTIFFLLLGLIQSLILLIIHRPTVVIGFGGYPSFPIMKMAQLLGVKTILHEQNGVLGVANNMLKKNATAIATSLPSIKNLNDKDLHKVQMTGNPVRQAILDQQNITYKPSLNDDMFHLLVTGGSQGAKIFSTIIPEAITLLPKTLQKRLSIIQQCREADLKHATALYKDCPAQITLSPFIKNIAEEITKSHLIICRSGASTVAEIAVIGRPAIFVPLTVHADQQQKINANALVDHDAGFLMIEDGFTADALSKKIETLMHLPEKLENIALNAKNCGHPNAAENLANLVIRVINEA